MPWSPMLLCGPRITNCTVGFLGFGRIAQATLARLLPFQISQALYLGSKPGQSAKEDFYGLVKEQKIPIQPAKNAHELAEKSDILIIGCALTPEIKHLVNKDFLERMKKTSVLVNIARGSVCSIRKLYRSTEHYLTLSSTGLLSTLKHSQLLWKADQSSEPASMSLRMSLKYQQITLWSSRGDAS